MIFVFLFLFGACFGSFLNVIIYRLPREQNIVFPRSQCPHCQKVIPWFENIPVFSFLFLRGHCSACKGKISYRYPLIEIIVAVVACFLGAELVFTLESLLLFLFKFSVFCILLAHFMIDLEHKILPDSLNIVLGILLFSYSLYFLPWGFWGLGALVGAGFPLLVTWGFYLLRGQIGLGGGDIKLYGVLGLHFGALGIIHTIFLSCFLGSLFGISAILLKKMDKSNPIAFGPFIIIVAFVQFFFPSFFNSYLIFV